MKKTFGKLKFRMAIRDLVRSRQDLRAAELLSRIQIGQTHIAWGYRNWGAFVADLPFGQRKANYLLGIWQMIEEHEIDRWRAVEIGWSKLAAIAGVRRRRNVPELLRKAEVLTLRQLQHDIAGG